MGEKLPEPDGPFEEFCECSVCEGTGKVLKKFLGYGYNGKCTECNGKGHLGIGYIEIL